MQKSDKLASKLTQEQKTTEKYKSDISDLRKRLEDLLHKNKTQEFDIKDLQKDKDMLKKKQNEMAGQIFKAETQVQQFKQELVIMTESKEHFQKINQKHQKRVLKANFQLKEQSQIIEKLRMRWKESMYLKRGKT